VDKKRTSTEGFDDLFEGKPPLELKSRGLGWSNYVARKPCAFLHDFGDPVPDEKYGGTVQTCKKCGDKFHQSEPRFYENEGQLDV
jgi:hypothetical protein